MLPEQSVREPEASQGVQHMCEEEQGACKEGRECDVVSEGGIQSRRPVRGDALYADSVVSRMSDSPVMTP